MKFESLPRFIEPAARMNGRESEPAVTPIDVTASKKQPSAFTFRRFEPLDHRETFLAALNDLKPVASADLPVGKYVAEHVKALLTGLQTTSVSERLRCYSSFAPPRLVEACVKGELIPFFGSGISIAAGIPSWAGLLERLGIASDYLSDPQVEHDPLTQAELLAHAVGADALQQELRDLTKRATSPTVAHRLLALMRLPAYITTNYDSLLEDAWKDEGNEPLLVVTNDLDVVEHKLDTAKSLPLRMVTPGTKPQSILIKIHGDARSDGNHLILARSDYRRHYRSNPRLFTLMKRLMLSGVTLFVGFSHRDPEASRLVEDVVYEYETRAALRRPPTLYSMQFDMRQRTPEVFAARGIVALRPPAVIAALSQHEARSAAVAVQLAELRVATDADDHLNVDLRSDIDAAAQRIADNIGKGLNTLAAAKRDVEKSLLDIPTLGKHLTAILRKLGPLAGQGVYATLSNGDIAGLAVPRGLVGSKRNRRKNFEDRPYFRQAKTFRTRFVSDVMKSVYNGHGTVFLCMPLGDEHAFNGLLFTACQPGAWRVPVQTRDALAKRGIELVLVDSNGVAIVPPVPEIKAVDSHQAPRGEKPGSNIGFPFARLRDYSRRDLHVAHITQNIVPVATDDDIHDISPDLRLFSMVASITGTRWKLALSRHVPSVTKA